MKFRFLTLIFVAIGSGAIEAQWTCQSINPPMLTKEDKKIATTKGWTDKAHAEKLCGKKNVKEFYPAQVKPAPPAPFKIQIRW